MVLRGTNQEYGRPYNRRIVLEAIRLHAPIARGDIARRVGLTVQTVSTIIRELELQGFISGSRDAAKKRGYPATSLAINPDGGFAIGLHLSPLGLEAALINLAGEVIGQGKHEMPHLEPDAAFVEIGKLVAAMRALKPQGRMLGIGLAMPGPFNVDSMSFVGPTTLEGWKGIPIRERLAQDSDLPVFIEVDHAAAALGERIYGVGRNIRDFYYLYFGVGLGGCMVQDGNALRGSHGNAGEIGHLPLVPNGEPCPCGNSGCLERYLSLEAMERRTREIGVKASIEEMAPLLQRAIVAIENMFDPQTIVLGGIAPDELLAGLLTAATPLPHSVAERKDRANPRVMLSTRGEDAVLRGAAALAVAGVLEPRFGLMFADDDERQRDPMMLNRNESGRGESGAAA